MLLSCMFYARSSCGTMPLITSCVLELLIAMCTHGSTLPMSFGSITCDLCSVRPLRLENIC